MTLNRADWECLVLSVQPRFADAIADGLKTIDVRRRRPDVRPGTLGFVYSSSPIQAVVGTFRVDRIFSGTPEELWLAAKGRAYLSRRDFEEYFAGVGFGHGIALSEGQRLAKPIKLSELRGIWPGCRPPRSFGYLVVADESSRRLMYTIRSYLFRDAGETGEVEDHCMGKTSPVERRGAFILRRQDMKSLLSLLGTD